MSASREKKTRQDLTSQGPTQREQKRQEEEKASRRSTLLYGTVGVVVVVAAIAMMVWNSGILQRGATALTIHGEKYTAADVQYYYNNLYNNYYYWGIFDTSTSLKDQQYDEQTGESWYDYLLARAGENLSADAALADKAKAEGYTLSQAAQDSVDATLEQLNSSWAVRGFSSRAAFLRANYGPYMTYDRFVSLLSRQALADDYAAYVSDNLPYSDSDYQAYYKEHTDELDTVTYSQFTLRAEAAVLYSQTEIDAMTDEQKTDALEEAKKTVSAKAEELRGKLAAGEKPEELAEEYASDLSGSDISQSQLGSALNRTWSEWALDSARRAGDVTVAETESGSTAYNYYVVLFEGRKQDNTPTRGVRHILVGAETDAGASQPTEEQYAAAKTKAEELLAQWKAGEATEDSFAALARENSADSGSAANGGLITNVTANSGYVQTFTDWVLDPTRKDGDTGIVQNTGSSIKGWHIMYYVSGDPAWQLNADSALRTQDMNDWREAAQKGYEVVTASGIKYVQA